VVPYDTYVFQLRGLVMVIFVAAQAPELVSRDLRSHVLPLYLCRPLRRLDYPLAKFAAFTAACLALIEIPLLLLYLGTIVSASGGAAVWSETRALIPGLLIGALWAVLFAAIGLVLASLTGRRAYATGAIAIYFFLSWSLASILIGVTGGRAGRWRARWRPGWPAWSARSRCWKGSGSGWAGPRPARSRARAAPGSCTGSCSSCSSGPASVAWPPGTGRRVCHEHDRAEPCLPLVRQRGGDQRHHDDDRARGHRLAGAERGREVHPAAPGRRVPRASRGS
jgi:hypothetical protein